jgi:hypothetical protein
MKKIILLLVILTTFSSISCTQNSPSYPEPFVKKNKYGLKLGKKVIVPARYDMIEPLDEDLFVAKLNSQCGILTKSGRLSVPLDYDDIKPFNNNIYLAGKNRKWGLINAFNGIILPLEYTGFIVVNDFMCQIRYKGKIGLINSYGGVIVLPEYDEMKPFNSETFLVKENGKSGILDKFGRVILPPEYDSFDKLADSDSYQVRKNGKIGVMDSDWNIIISPEYDSITDCSVGKNLAQNGKIGFYTSSGKLIRPSFTQVLFYQPEFGLAVVKIGEKRGFVTSNGTVVEPVYENISRFSGKGIAFVEKNGKLMAVNISGKEMTLQETMGNTPPAPGR